MTGRAQEELTRAIVHDAVRKYIATRRERIDKSDFQWSVGGWTPPLPTPPWTMDKWFLSDNKGLRIESTVHPEYVSADHLTKAEVSDIIALAAKYKIDDKRSAVMGHSAGGQLALCLAGREQQLKGAISLAGVVDLKRAWELHLSKDAALEFMGGTPQQVPEHFHEASPITVAIPKVQQVLIHGAKDDTVPVDFSRDYVQLKKEHGEHVQAGSRRQDGRSRPGAAWAQFGEYGGDHWRAEGRRTGNPFRYVTLRQL